MNVRHMILAGVAALSATTAPAFAFQAAAPAAAVTPTTGAQVFDAQGGSVGTIASVSGTTAVIDTGTNKAAVPFASFAKGDKGLLLGMTKVELDAAASAATADAKAKFAAKLIKGTPVVDSAGSPLGTVDTNDGSFVTLARGASKVKLPIAAFGPTASGDGIQIGMTAAALDAAAKQAGAPAVSTSAAAAASGDADTNTASPQ